MKLIEAIEKRKSIRAFMNHKIEDDIMDRIKENIEKADRLYVNSKINIVISDYCSKSFKAPYYIGIYTDGTKEGNINAGYVMQQMVIYLTAIGIGTCYQANTHIFKEKDSCGRTLTISLAFGYANGALYRKADEAKRLKLEKLCVIKEEPNSEILKLLNLARIAPSSYNSQPWRFVVYSNRVHIFLGKNNFFHVAKYAYINMGVLLANVIVGAEEQWIDISVKEIDEIKEKQYGTNKYIMTIYHANKDGKII